jgi:hypothetical protein
MRKFERNSVPLDDDSWGSARNAEAQEVTSRGVDDELGGRRAGLKDTSNARLEAECSEVIGKGRHTR